MNVQRFGLASALLTVTAISLTACGTPASGVGGAGAPAVDASSMEALVEAAKAEGKLSLYGELQEPDMVRFAEGFAEKYDIDVQPLRLGGNSLAQRFDAEVKAGGATADMLITLDLEFLADVIERDLVVPFDESGVKPLLEDFPEEFSFTNPNVPLLQTISTGFIYNTDKVTADELPATWDALVDNERWKGQYCSVDPATTFSVVQFFSVVRESASSKALQEYGANIGRWYPNIVAMNEAVAVGECVLGINSAKFFVEGMKAAASAPVEFAYGPSTIHPVVTAAVVDGAAHPNAARLFLHYILSEEGNAMLNAPAAGSLGPWDGGEMADDFWVPEIEDFEGWREESPEIQALLGL